MWTVIHIASSRTHADTLKRCLESEGHLVKVRAMGSAAQSDVGTFEVMVPQSEARDAHEVVTARISR